MVRASFIKKRKKNDINFTNGLISFKTFVRSLNQSYRIKINQQETKNKNWKSNLFYLKIT